MSAMTYLPQSDAELVTLACWASNVVGRQMAPCLIHILPASKWQTPQFFSWHFWHNFFTEVPESPRFCELHNDTILEVICTAGNDGGLSQHFVLEVLSSNGMPSIYINLDSTRSTHEIVDNELPTMNDQVGFVVINSQTVRIGQKFWINFWFF